MASAHATFYNWESKYGGLEASDVKRMKELEEENAKLKRMFADMSLENHALKAFIQKSLDSHRNPLTPALGGRFYSSSF